MADPQLKALAERLARRTLEGALEWQKYSFEDSFQVPFGDYTLVISHDDGDLGRDYVVTIYDELGEVVERFSDVDLDEGSGDHTYFHTLKAVHERARRMALGSAKAVRDILSRLGE